MSYEEVSKLYSTYRIKTQNIDNQFESEVLDYII